MKDKLILLVSFMLVLGFQSCEIREPEIKPDFAKTGKQMFNYADENIFNLIGLFDKVLFLDTYQNTTDSLKYKFKDDYFQQYLIKNPVVNKWYFIRTSDNDTIYTIITDSKSIHSPNAEWLINEKYNNNFCTIQCVSDKKWQVKMLQGYLSFWHAEAGLNIECTDSVAPSLYQTGNFKITGDGILESAESYTQQVRLTYQIKDTLVHRQSVWVFTEGSIDVSAKDLETNQSESANGRYYMNRDNKNELEITYHNRTQIYDNWYDTSYMW